MSDPKNGSSHQAQSVRVAGGPLDCARAAIPMAHGLGARADNILSLLEQLAPPALICPDDTPCDYAGSSHWQARLDSWDVVM